MSLSVFRAARRNPRYVAYLANLTLIALIIWSAWGSYDLFVLAERELPNSEINVARNRVESVPPVDLALIMNANLFGASEPAEDSNPTEVQMQFVPETALDLALTGVFSMSGGVSQAIVKAGANAARAYSVGDSIGAEAVVHQISTRYIVIRRAGAYETLWLERDKPTSREQQIIAISQAPGAEFKPNKSPTGGKVAISELERQMVADARHIIFTENKPVSKYVRIQAISEKGSLKGYRIYPGRDPALFNALEFEKGDLVEAVNGTDLSSADTKLDDVLAELRGSETLTLRIKRGGVDRVREFDLGS